MRCLRERFVNRDGTPGLRLRFLEFAIDGKKLPDVSIVPHLCATCVEGDHVHVEIGDDRALIESCGEITVGQADLTLIEQYVRAKLKLNERVATLNQFLAL